MLRIVLAMGAWTLWGAAVVGVFGVVLQVVAVSVALAALMLGAG